MQIKFVKSAVLPKDYPQDQKLEVAIAGRSNAGKSSLINALAGTRIAKVSQEPGKTRLLNFFDVGRFYRLVDMPGYGFAARAGDEQVNWHKMIDDYLFGREQLVGIILIMDIRRDWSGDEEALQRTFAAQGVPLIVVLSKSDKLKKSEQKQRQKLIEKKAKGPVFLISSLKRDGVKEFEEAIFEQWIKPHVSGEVP